VQQNRQICLSDGDNLVYTMESSGASFAIKSEAKKISPHRRALIRSGDKLTAAYVLWTTLEVVTVARCFFPRKVAIKMRKVAQIRVYL